MDLDELTAMAAAELTTQGLADWTFRLADTGRRLGVCKYRRRRIEIATYYARHSPAVAVRDTLLHEIAHALAGPAARHGPAWKAIAARFGATPRACDMSPDTVVKPGDWQATCAACRKVFHRYRRPRTLTGYRCRCVGRGPLTFAFQGDPTRRPVGPEMGTETLAANWEATCAGCRTVHRRARRHGGGGVPRAAATPGRCESTMRRTGSAPGCPGMAGG